MITNLTMSINEYKTEDQNNFLFMDEKVIRNTQKKLSESLIYRKSIISGTFTNSKSFFPIINLVCQRQCYYVVFQYAPLTKSFMRKFLSQNRNL